MQTKKRSKTPVVSSSEPSINILSYNIDLIKALNYYNVNSSCKEKQEWTIELLQEMDINNKNDIKDILIKDVPDHEFHSIGSLARLKIRDQYLSDKEELFIQNEIKRLVSSYKKSEDVMEKSPKIIQKNINMIPKNFLEFTESLEIMVDEFINDNRSNLEFNPLIKIHDLSSNLISKIPDIILPRLEELNLVISGSDDELVEGYSNLSRPKIRKLIKAYSDLIESSQIEKKAVRVARKPRKKREQPVSKIVAKVNYQKENEELNLKSELPSKLVGATEVWLYNTKYKKLQVYKVTEPSKMSVKGTTLIGWDPVLSNMKPIRKPTEIKNLVTMGKRELNRTYKDLPTKEQTVNGRLNEHTIILKVFS
jgi:hypothetical protein